MREKKYDVVVVGGGHSGCEAALASSRMGASTLLLNIHLENTALMACNPSLGGPAKGHMVREIDALGGYQGEAADASTLHLRWLNTSKGPAVRTLRAQCDMRVFHSFYRRLLEGTENLYIHQAMATDILVRSNMVRGVRTSLGDEIDARCVILCTGTYLYGAVHIGLSCSPSGPLGEMRSHGISESLRELGFSVRRFKTGTPPRLHMDSIDYSGLLLQPSDSTPAAFSHFSRAKTHTGYFCAQTRTNSAIHNLINDNLDRSPLYSGVIQGVGPRYCPSIEDKVVKFPQKESHPIFLEPVSADNKEIYVQNFSTSMPYDVQVRMVRMLPGCENAHILKPGYAIEYDCIDPRALRHSLESRSVCGLYFAGQINGTSGYEEAAMQGMICGINAALSIRGYDPVILGRHEAYGGVLIDDLVSKGTEEPYRMLTSRCEYRLLMRHDNADVRMSPTGRKLGLIDDAKWRILNDSWEKMDDIKKSLSEARITPAMSVSLANTGTPPVEEAVCAAELLLRPEVRYEDVAVLCGLPVCGEGERVEVEFKYSGYIDRQNRQISKMARMESLPIPDGFDYASVGLLSESCAKLAAARPETLGQASRIAGVTPSDIHLLWAYMEQRRKNA